eukprot:COSAG04_NODE_480_length_13676_cov_4.040657_1_plen_998_part_00
MIAPDHQGCALTILAAIVALQGVALIYIATPQQQQPLDAGAGARRALQDALSGAQSCLGADEIAYLCLEATDAVSQGLEAKANTVDMTTQLALKAGADDVDVLSGRVDGKAGSDDVDALSGRLDAVTTTVAGKMDPGAVALLLADKVDKEEVAALLAAKVNFSDFETLSTALGGKVDGDTLAALLEGKVDGGTLATLLGDKTNMSDFQALSLAVDGKVDGSTMTALLEDKAAAADLSSLTVTVDGKAAAADVQALELALAEMAGTVQIMSAQLANLQGAEGGTPVHMLRRVCSAANLTACVPPCHGTTSGYLLSIEIESRGTVMTCNKVDSIFSWEGLGSLGGYIGSSFAAFFSSVISGAAGTYMTTLSESQDVQTDLTCQPGQLVMVSGDRALAAAPTWGSGGITVGESASLALSYIQIETVIQMSQGALSLRLDSCVLTFADTLVLRVAEATLLGQVFQGGLEVPSGADVQFLGDAMTFAGSSSLEIAGSASITDFNMTFADSISIGMTVQAGGSVTVSGSTFATASAATIEMVRVNTGGALTVEDSTLTRADGSADPFPCDGAMPDCAGPHAGPVVVNGPASINTDAPLICPADGVGDCLYGYVDVPSCLANVVSGMVSCFIYLQADALALETVAAGEPFEVHGNGEPLLQLQADWTVASGASLLLADLRLVGGSGAGGVQLDIEAGGELSLQRVEMQDGRIAFAGTVSMLDSTLTTTELLGTPATAALTLSGGTLTGSTTSISSGSATMESCVLANSPVTVSGTAEAPGTLTLSCQLQSDGSSVPLTVQAGGSATVSGSEFQTTAGDDITAVSVEEGGSMAVSESQLVAADGSADPFPCVGTLPTCAGAHDGSVDVAGPAAITLASPLVCDTITGACLSDLCFVVDCGDHGTCVSPGGGCECTGQLGWPPYSGDRCETGPTQPCCRGGVYVGVGGPCPRCGEDGTSPEARCGGCCGDTPCGGCNSCAIAQSPCYCDTARPGWDLIDGGCDRSC